MKEYSCRFHRKSHFNNPDSFLKQENTQDTRDTLVEKGAAVLSGDVLFKNIKFIIDSPILLKSS